MNCCRGDGVIVLDDDGGGGVSESSNGSTAAAAGKGKEKGGGGTAAWGGCSLAHASRCLHNVLYLCSARAQASVCLLLSYRVCPTCPSLPPYVALFRMAGVLASCAASIKGGDVLDLMGCNSRKLESFCLSSGVP